MVAKITSKEEFDRIIAGDKVVFVDFYADWCGPCRMISPHFEKLAGAHADNEGVEFYKLDIDAVEAVAAELRISSIPTFHAFKNGERIDQTVGANPATLTALVTKTIASSL